ncbi:MAG: dTDP-4-dehydrorhamnose reductase [Elusimicrobiota bacterium]
MRFLITGAYGQLAKEFINLVKGEVYAFDVDKLDITSEKLVNEAIEAYKPSFLINCAAYNNVDRAESDIDSAFKVNAFSLKYFSRACEKYKTKIIHFSTDFVFPGKPEKVPYRESDAANPVNKYGESKLGGERLLAENYENYAIFRVSWLYGQGNQNFPFKLKSWAKDKNELKIAQDEVSVPTPTSFVAGNVIKGLDLKGVWHLCCKGFASRYEWALKIAEKEGLQVKISGARQADFALPAKRPVFSAMDSNKLASELGVKFPDWNEFYE